MKLPVYFDYAATTPMDPRVFNKMKGYLTIDGVFGNPSSKSHYYGWRAEEAVDIARNQISKLIFADPREIIFTSGATESNNLAIKGVAEALKNKGSHIITSAIEHKSVLDTCLYLENNGYKITRLKPKSNGLIDLSELHESFRKDTILVSIMQVNNEIGVIQDIESFGNICRDHDVLFHVDATQAIGKLPINLSVLPIDLMSFSAHKFYGPKGIGCLYVRRNPTVCVEAQIHGGGHEFGMRSGTLPVHQIVGMGEACRIVLEEMESEDFRFRKLRHRFWKGLQKIDGIVLNGDFNNSILTLFNVNFCNINGELLITALKNIALSSSSACVSAKMESSYVLRALGLSYEHAHNAVRFSFGRFTTQEEIDYVICQLRQTVFGLREMVNLDNLTKLY